jgi:hypothetical protein
MAFNVLVNGQTVSLALNSDEFFNTGEGRIRVFNNGTAVITNAEVVVTVPAGITISGSTPTQGVFLVDTWTIGTINPGTPANDEFLDLEFTITDETLAPFVITYVLTHDDTPDDTSTDNAGERTISGISCSTFLACVCSSDVSAIRTIDEDDDIALTDGTVLVIADSEEEASDVTLTLPLAADAYSATDEVSGCGRKFTIKVLHNDGGNNSVFLSAQVGEVIVNDTTIAGASQTVELTELGSSIKVQSDGVNWYIIT